MNSKTMTEKQFIKYMLVAGFVAISSSGSAISLNFSRMIFVCDERE